MNCCVPPLHPSPVLPTSATAPGTEALVRAKEDAAAAMGWCAGDMGLQIPVSHLLRVWGWHR